MIKAIFCLKKQPLVSDAEFISRFQQRHQIAFYRFAELSGAEKIDLALLPNKARYQGFVPEPQTGLDALIEIRWHKHSFEQFCNQDKRAPRQLELLFASLGGLVNLQHSQLRLVEPESTLYP